MAFFPFPFDLLLVCGLGLVLGSFSTALAWRVPLGKSWGVAAKPGEGRPLFERSACPRCGAVLRARDLVPVFSWLFLKGRCRRCGGSIGAWYPAAELLTLGAALACYAVMGLTPASLVVIAALPFLVALAIVDMRYMILPDQLVAALAVAGVLRLLAEGAVSGFGGAFMSEAAFRLAGAAVFGGLAWGLRAAAGFVLKKEAMGFGDVKLFAVSGLWLGLPLMPLFLVGAGGAGVLWGGAQKIFFKNRFFPFGPAIILSLYICILLKN